MLVTLKQLGGEMSGAVLWHPQFKPANARDQRAAVMPGAIAQPLRRPLTLRRPQRLIHLGFQNLLHHLPQPSGFESKISLTATVLSSLLVMVPFLSGKR
jgi:hypothetical protein